MWTAPGAMFRDRKAMWTVPEIDVDSGWGDVPRPESDVDATRDPCGKRAGAIFQARGGTPLRRSGARRASHLGHFRIAARRRPQGKSGRHLRGGKFPLRRSGISFSGTVFHTGSNSRA
jgi:hypothetical protein